MATLIIYRGAYICGRIGCGEILDRHGHCPDYHYAIPEWVGDGVEIEVELYGHTSKPEPSVGWRGGATCEGAEFEGKPFPLTDEEQERADEEFAEQEDAAEQGRYEDAMEAKAEAAREREWEQ